jgi:hypothetical protein
MVFGVKRRQALSPTSCYEPCTRKSRMLGGRDAERSIGDTVNIVREIGEWSTISLKDRQQNRHCAHGKHHRRILYCIPFRCTASASCRGSSCFLVNFVIRSVHSFDGVAKSSSIYQNETLKENFIITFYLKYQVK